VPRPVIKYHLEQEPGSRRPTGPLAREEGARRRTAVNARNGHPDSLDVAPGADLINNSISMGCVE
jgi:hypothetical protein